MTLEFSWLPGQLHHHNGPVNSPASKFGVPIMGCLFCWIWWNGGSHPDRPYQNKAVPRGRGLLETKREKKESQRKKRVESEEGSVFSLGCSVSNLFAGKCGKWILGRYVVALATDATYV